jgi:hypothetical protein
MNELEQKILIAKAVHKTFVEREAKSIPGVRSRLAFRLRKADEWKQREQQLREEFQVAKFSNRKIE